MSKINENEKVDVKEVESCVNQETDIVELRKKYKALEEAFRITQTQLRGVVHEVIVHRNERILEAARIKFLEGKVLSLQYNPTEAQKRYETETLAQLNDMTKQLIASEVLFCEERRKEWEQLGQELLKVQQDNEKQFKLECEEKVELIRLDYEERLKRAEIHRMKLEHELRYAQWQLEGKTTVNTLESLPNNVEQLDEVRIERQIPELKRVNGKRNLSAHNSPEAPHRKRQCVDDVVVDQTVLNVQEEEVRLQETENNSAVAIDPIANVALTVTNADLKSHEIVQFAKTIDDALEEPEEQPKPENFEAKAKVDENQQEPGDHTSEVWKVTIPIKNVAKKRETTN